MTMKLSGFESIRPAFEAMQEETLEWLVQAHAASHARKSKLSDAHPEISQFRKEIREKLWHVGCKPDSIRSRGHVLSDYLHCDWKTMQVYRLDESPAGSNLDRRMAVFESHADRIFEQFYPSEESPPNDLIHVTCTGYISPSGAQKIVSLRGWGAQTTVTHAYHMGCYGSIPALRIASGFAALQRGRTDIVHTEICSLHANPSMHSLDQLVTQSLFADGFIKYSADPHADGPHIRVLALQEETIPDSLKSMTWKTMNWGFEMSLAKEVPSQIARALDASLHRLCKKANRFPEKILSEALFAVHPGGPKILHYVRKLLQLKEPQLEHSFSILNNYGNMSSATLPHIWKAILEDDAIPTNTPIVSFAFGPGLTICSAVMEKCNSF